MFSFKEYLFEIFDKPWGLQEITHTHLGKVMRKQVKEKTGGDKKFRLYKAEGKNGYILEFHHNGAMEIHHLDEMGDSGVTTKSSKPNPRFFSTIKHRIEHHFKTSGESTRVVGNTKDNMIHTYHRLAQRYAKKHHLEVTKLTDHNNIDDSKEERKEFLIHPRHVIDEEFLNVFKKALEESKN